MPPERNIRSIVEVPELFVSGLLHESGLADLARLDRIQPRHALENHLVITDVKQSGRPRYARRWLCRPAGR